MDAMDTTGGARAEEIEFTPALGDVDMDLLVETGFNKAGTGNAQPNVEPRKMLEEGLDDQESLMQADSYLNIDILTDFSPRNISNEHDDDQMEKESQVPYLTDNRELRVPLSVHTERFDQGSHRGATGSTTLVAAAIAHPSLSEQTLCTRHESLNPIPPPVLEASFLKQREWHNPLPSSESIAITTALECEAPPVTIDVETSLPVTPPAVPPGPVQVPPSSQSKPVPKPQSKGRASLKALKVPMKSGRKKSEKARTKETASRALSSNPSTAALPPSAKGSKKGNAKRRANPNAHLSVEERKKLRAERNRESAEKSRMRRKKMILELETNVAFLREENRDLKAKVERYYGHLTSTSAEVKRRSEASDGDSQQADTAKLPALYEALSALQRCMDECPRTFRKGPHSPVIPLNIRR